MRISDRITFDDEYLIRRTTYGIVLRRRTDQGWEKVLTTNAVYGFPVLDDGDNRLRAYEPISKQEAEEMMMGRVEGPQGCGPSF
jgi:hypothetical protein